LLSLLCLVAACHKPSPPNQPPVSEGGDPGHEDADAGADDADAGDEGSDVPGPLLPDGPLCDSHADCGAGMVCEGVGCGPGEGRCAPQDRMCTRDLASYCGCDGELFQSSGTCPGDRYAYRGPCDPALEVGEACTDGRQCKSALCVGEGLEGCSRSDQGVCAEDIACTDDLAPYCNCNNVSFAASGSCPNQQFAYRGACEGA